MQSRPDSDTNDFSYTALAVAEGFCLDNFSYTNDLPDLVDNDVKEWSLYLLEAARSKYPHNIHKGVIGLADKVHPSITQFLYQIQGATYYPQQIALRKKYIAQLVRDAINAGAKQVLYLGGGLDVMCLTLHSKYPDVQFFEIDRGGHRTIKIDELQRRNALNSNIHFIDADIFAPDWRAKLKSGGFSESELTVCVIEGLTVYLSPLQCDTLLQNLHEILHPASTLISSFVEPVKTASTGLQSKFFAQHSEAYQSTLPRYQVPLYLYDQGFTAKERLSYLDMQRVLDLVPEDQQESRGFLRENYYVSQPKRDGDTIPLEKDLPVTQIRLTHVENENRGCVIC